MYDIMIMLKKSIGDTYSHKPDRRLHLNACHLLLVALRIGDATAIPSGMLCAAIAIARGRPRVVPRRHAR